MSKELKTKEDKLEIKNIPISGSLGLLAIGDLAFKQWRRVKIENNKFKRDHEEGKTKK